MFPTNKKIVKFIRFKLRTYSEAIPNWFIIISNWNQNDFFCCSFVWFRMTVVRCRVRGRLCVILLYSSKIDFGCERPEKKKRRRWKRNIDSEHENWFNWNFKSFHFVSSLFTLFAFARCLLHLVPCWLLSLSMPLRIITVKFSKRIHTHNNRIRSLSLYGRCSYW